MDGSDPIVLAAARGLQSLPTGRASSADGRAPPARFEVRAYYNPERRSAVQIVPALIGVILTMTMVLFTAVAVVRERERGNLELLITTPVTRSELMVGKLLPYMFIGLVQVSLVLLLGSLLFRVPIRGTLPDVYAAALVFVVASLSLGLLISTLADTQFQAFQLTFFSFLPQILLSGFMFPFDRHAAAGSVDRRGPSPDALHPHDARHSAARRRPGRVDAGDLAAAALLRGHREPGRVPLPEAARLRPGFG